MAKTINVSDNVHKELKYISTIKGKKIKDVVEEALLKYIDQEEDADLTIIKKDKIIKEYYR